MALGYAWRGVIGVLTPQANTTVEPEFAIMAPPGVVTLTARLVSGAPRMDDRLHEYFAQLPPACAQFANAPIRVVAVACTGASYLAAAGGEAALVSAAEAVTGVPVLTSARCVTDALRTLEARRIGLVSPYGATLTQASVRYWTAAGFTVAGVAELTPEPGSFHPVYGLQGDAVTAALDRLADRSGFDAVVILGTGLPSLQTILDRPRVGQAPVLSSMLATAWRSVLVLDGVAPDRVSLMAWIDQPAWGGRLRARLKPVSAGRAAS